MNPFTHEMRQGAEQLFDRCSCCGPTDEDDVIEFGGGGDEGCCSSLTRTRQFDAMQVPCFIVFMFCLLILGT